MGYNEEMPANSVWRYECKRVAKQESRPKPQPNESVTTPGLSLAEVARQFDVTTSAITREVRRPGAVSQLGKQRPFPRVKDSEVLLTAIRDGLGLLIWKQDAFASADGWDEVGSR
jgi:hypothetical protein